MSDEAKFEKMAKEVKELAELQAYADAQFKTITGQNKTINSLKEQIVALEKLLSHKDLSVPAQANVIQFPNYAISNEEQICIEQIASLRMASGNRELTMEECRKLEVYAKILLSLRNKEKDIDTTSKKMSTDELLKLTELK